MPCERVMRPYGHYITPDHQNERLHAWGFLFFSYYYYYYHYYYYYYYHCCCSCYYYFILFIYMYITRHNNKWLVGSSPANSTLASLLFLLFLRLLLALEPSLPLSLSHPPPSQFGASPTHLKKIKTEVAIWGGGRGPKRIRSQRGVK